MGRHLVESLLSKNANVTVLVRRKDALPSQSSIEMIEADILKDFDLPKFDIVFHLAGFIDVSECLKNPRKAFEVNALGTLNLLEKVGKKAAKFVYASTIGVYGENATVPVDEKQMPLPTEIYAASKYAAENIILSYKKTCGINAVIARIANCYGEGQNDRFIIPCIIRQLLTKDIVELGCITSIRDFLYVKDVISALVLLAQKAEEDVYNVGSGIGTIIGDIPKFFSTIANKKWEVVSLESKKRPVGINRSIADVSRLKKLGWTPQYSLQDGLLKTYRYYQERLKF